jgi:hypothetical protein
VPRLPFANRSAALVLGLAAIGCGSKSPSITGVTVAVTFSGVSVEQLEVACSTSTDEVLGSQLRPEKAGPSLGSPQSVSVYLPDTLVGETLTCTVAAHAGGEVTARGAGTATLVLHKLVSMPVLLSAGSGGDGSAPTDGPPADADGGAPTDATTDVPSDGPRANGAPCTANEECESTVCVDGVCCSTGCNGLCEACNLPNKMGTCSPEPAGTPAPGTAGCTNQGVSTCGFDGTCDGSGHCRRYQEGAPCKAAACQGSLLYMPPGACDGLGTCVTPANVECAPYICDTTGAGAAPACRTTCRPGGTDCQSPAVCANDSCGAKVKKGDGAGCVDNSDCTSTHCVDGVCCNTACTASCTSCNQMGNEGKCLSVPAGKPDPRKMCVDAGATTCGKNGLCDGAGACQLYPTTAICANASCSGRNVRPARHCDGKGACVTVADVDCQPYRCDPMTAACFKSCTDNSQCSNAPKRTCNTQTMMCAPQ